MEKIEPGKDGYVLAEGEATGHAHRIKDVSAVKAMFKLDGTLQWETVKPVELTHEEHKPVKIPVGEYESGIVREFDHYTEEARNVAD